MAKNTYRIDVFTNHVTQGGTNGDIFIEIQGEYGTIPFFQIDNAEDNFEQGKTDTFFVARDSSIGNITQIGLRLHYLGYGDSWSAGWVQVTHQFEYFDMVANATRVGSFPYLFNVNYAFNKLKGFHDENDETKYFPTNDHYDDAAKVPHDGATPTPPTKPEPGKSIDSTAELIITAPGWFEPSFVHPDETLSFHFPIANIGNAPANAFTIQLYLHADRDTSAPPLRSTTTPGQMGPGQTSTVYWILAGLPKGLYTCTIILDSTNVVAEVYEGASNSTYIEVDVSDSEISGQSQPLSVPLVRRIEWVRLTKATATHPTPRIDMVGGLDHDAPWSVRVEEAIEHIRHKQMAYFTSDPQGRKAAVGVDDTTHPGFPFLRTAADTSIANNLRSLPSPGEFYNDFVPAGHAKPLPA